MCNVWDTSYTVRLQRKSELMTGPVPLYIHIFLLLSCRLFAPKWRKKQPTVKWHKSATIYIYICSRYFTDKILLQTLHGIVCLFCVKLTLLCYDYFMLRCASWKPVMLRFASLLTSISCKDVVWIKNCGLFNAWMMFLHSLLIWFFFLWAFQ